jgi:hypothetical protein
MKEEVRKREDGEKGSAVCGLTENKLIVCRN